MATLKQLQEEIHETAKEKGWYDGRTREKLEMHMLMVSEIAEASEEVRNDMPEFYFLENGEILDVAEMTSDKFLEKKHLKPEGESIELADCVIRIMDYFEKMGWNLETAIRIKMNYNKTRGYRHGGKTV